MIHFCRTVFWKKFWWNSKLHKVDVSFKILAANTNLPEAMFTKAVDNFVDNSGVHRRQCATVRLLSQLPCHWAEKFVR
jgi:hypothetical protein